MGNDFEEKEKEKRIKKIKTPFEYDDCMDNIRPLRDIKVLSEVTVMKAKKETKKQKEYKQMQKQIEKEKNRIKNGGK